MKKIILLIHLLISFQLYSQHLAIDKIDEFTNDHIIKVNVTQGNKWRGSDDVAEGLITHLFISTIHERAKSSYLTNLVFDLTYGNQICATNMDGSTIILLENNEKIELKQVSQIDCANRIVIKYHLPLDALKILSKNIISKVRIYTADDGYLDITIKEKKKLAIMEHFQILESKINNL